MSGRYYIALICNNGHLVNARANLWVQFNSPYCSRCGAHTIDTCPACKNPIRGEYSGAFASYDVPGFCLNCGSPFPWTEMAKKAAVEYLQLKTILRREDIGTIGQSIDELMKGTPLIQVAAARINDLIDKAGPAVQEGMKAILWNFLSTAAQKALGW